MLPFLLIFYEIQSNFTMFPLTDVEAFVAYFTQN